MAASKSKPASKKERDHPADASADKILREFDRQKALLTEKQVSAIERHFRQDGGDAQYRRVGLAMLMQSGKRLVELAESDRETGEMLADAAEGIKRSAKRHQLLAEFLESSATRVEVALCVREDMVDLLKAAKTEHDEYSEAANG